MNIDKKTDVIFIAYIYFFQYHENLNFRYEDF